MESDRTPLDIVLELDKYEHDPFPTCNEDNAARIPWQGATSHLSVRLLEDYHIIFWAAIQQPRPISLLVLFFDLERTIQKVCPDEPIRIEARARFSKIIILRCPSTT